MRRRPSDSELGYAVKCTPAVVLGSDRLLERTETLVTSEHPDEELEEDATVGCLFRLSYSTLEVRCCSPRTSLPFIEAKVLVRIWSALSLLLV